MTHKYVYLFSEGDASMRNLLGGKGANPVSYTHLDVYKRQFRCSVPLPASAPSKNPRFSCFDNALKPIGASSDPHC